MMIDVFDSLLTMNLYNEGLRDGDELDLSEMDKLAKGLDEKQIPYIRKPMMDGEQIVVNDADGEYLWDAILHCGSYGHEDGLIEVMGKTVVRIDYDEVEGYLTADEILSRI